MSIILGGPTAWQVLESGQLVVAFHWVNREPAMCLYPKRKPLGCVPFVIPLASAWSYATNKGYPTPRCMEQAVVAANVMGLDMGRDTLKGIVTAIVDNLHELVAMPPEPQQFTQAQQRVIGEAVLTHGRGGERLAGGEIMDEPDPDYTPDATPSSLILPSHLH